MTRRPKQPAPVAQPQTPLPVPLPSSGGSYLREADDLRRIEPGTPETAPETAPETPAVKEA